jgi:hypothetical protein
MQRKSLIARTLEEQDGQVLPWVAFMMILLIGIGAFVLDTGHAYVCYHELQAATDAAALAGAQQLRNSTAISVATSYSAISGNLNTDQNIPNVSMVPGYPALKCLSTIKAMGMACTAPNNANAIQVKEQAMIPTFFAGIFGIRQMSLSTTATAAVAGAKARLYNVAVVIDTTSSMNTFDSNCGATRIACAENGVQVLLQNLSPCSLALGCGSVSNGVSPNALDSVSIFTFPPVTNGTASKDYNCSSDNPTIVSYTLPTIGATSYAPSGSGTGTYQITGFLSDYKSTDASSTLYGSSEVSTAVGAGSQSGSSCPGMAAPGGDGTYYAGVIYAAQASLAAAAAAEVAANSTANPLNIMVILTDGEANASSSKFDSTEANGTPLATKNTFPGGGGAASSLTNYPSPFDQCEQAVAAANYAKSQGAIVYTVAYGSESSGCTTDTTGPQAYITPCQVMSEMASGPSYFYSDYNQSGSSSTCVSGGTSVSEMNDIFTAISADFLLARLIPDNTT